MAFQTGQAELVVASHDAVGAKIGGYFLDSVAMGHELRLPRDAWRTFYLCELIHRGVADLTLHRFVVVHHRKCERQPLVVVSSYSATSQRHPKSPFQGGSDRNQAD